MRRFLPFLIALCAACALVAGVVAATDGVAAPAGSPLRLRTASMEDMTSQGILLSTATEPPYCVAAEALLGRLRPEGRGPGCPIGSGAASAAALREAGRGRVVENVLALVSLSGASGRVTNRLARVVVVYGGAVIVPEPPYCPRGSCPPPAFQLLQDRVVVIDAHTGAVLTAVTVSPTA